MSNERYAIVQWAAGDVQTLFDVSDEDAQGFLEANSRHIQERMTEAGWSAIEHLGHGAGLTHNPTGP